MQQTFFKTIQGHKIEFNRLLYPVHYQISTKDIESIGAIILLQKDETGMWNLTGQEILPGWVNEISLDLHEAILDNEVSIA